MQPFLYKFFHRKTNDRSENGLIHIPKDSNEWPESWKKIEYKNFFSHTPLPLPSIQNSSFKEVLLNRRSSTVIFSKNELTLEKLSHILWSGYGLQEGKGDQRSGSRTVPSAGKRFPLEIYVFLLKSTGFMKAGVYHYGIKRHELEPVTFREFTNEDLTCLTNQENLYNANGIICMTAVFSRTVEKYGSRGYRYILQESGHAAQNMLLAGSEKGIDILPVGATTEYAFEEIIGLNSDERVVYTLFF